MVNIKAVSPATILVLVIVLSILGIGGWYVIKRATCNDEIVYHPKRDSSTGLWDSAEYHSFKDKKYSSHSDAMDACIF